MNKLQQILSKTTVITLCLLTIGTYGQKQTKTFKETFNVGNDAVLNINTSYADIEFETWGKDQVVVEATVELEGASSEEAKAYFENSGVKIIGNSKNIEISTGVENPWFFTHSIGDLEDFHIEIPDLPDLEPLFLDLEIPDLPELMEMPPMPPIPFTNFDYDAYKKDGEKYMKKWRQEFDKNFDEDYKKRISEWSERMAIRAEEWEKRREERNQWRKEREEERRELLRERNELREEAREERDRAREERDKLRKDGRDVKRSIIISRDGDDSPNIFYRSSKGMDKNYKVKKTIRIKMPKSTKIKMNVRHGEVKLAENASNINATLSYASLLASTIDGDQTSIIASYSPVTVENWNYGQLKTDFSDAVNLEEVANLKLYSNSSSVTIDRLLKSALIKNNLGRLKINSVSENFTDMDISVQNGELVCELPQTAYKIYVNGTSSKLTTPTYLVLDRTKNSDNTIHSGYHISKNNGKSIIVNSKFSEVVFEK